jgi:hypothetical protein
MPGARPIKVEHELTDSSDMQLRATLLAVFLGLLLVAATGRTARPRGACVPAMLYITQLLGR